MLNAPDIKPIKVKEFEVKQSKYPHCGKLPIRSIVLGPSGSGKTVLLANLILDVYRGCFARIFIFSPSIDVDYTWNPVKEYIEKEMKVKDSEEEPIYFNYYDPEALTNIIETQSKIIEHMKKQGSKKLHQILIIIDDFSDDIQFSRQFKILHALYTRGRHHMISTITSTQKFNAIAPIIRIDATELYVYKIRNQKDLDALIEELSAIIDKTLLQLFNTATSIPHSFLYIKLTARNINEMFYINLNQKMIIED